PNTVQIFPLSSVEITSSPKTQCSSLLRKPSYPCSPCPSPAIATHTIMTPPIIPLPGEPEHQHHQAAVQAGALPRRREFGIPIDTTAAKDPTLQRPVPKADNAKYSRS